MKRIVGRGKEFHGFERGSYGQQRWIQVVEIRTGGGGYLVLRIEHTLFRPRDHRGSM